MFRYSLFSFVILQFVHVQGFLCEQFCDSPGNLCDLVCFHHTRNKKLNEKISDLQHIIKVKSEELKDTETLLYLRDIEVKELEGNQQYIQGLLTDSNFTITHKINDLQIQIQIHKELWEVCEMDKNNIIMTTESEEDNEKIIKFYKSKLQNITNILGFIGILFLFLSFFT